MPSWGRATTEARRQILDLLLSQGPLSRADLARLTELNKPTISNLINRLIDEELVREIGAGVSTGGRKPILLDVDASSRLVIGVELDAAGGRLLLVTLTGEPIAAADLSFCPAEPAAVIDAIVTGVQRLSGDGPWPELLGCGVAVPGVADRQRNSVRLPFPFNWNDLPLGDLLERQLDIPVLVTDRGKAAGLGEMWRLGKERSHDLIYLYLGGGVGGAIVLGQEVQWGASNMAGEIGHMIVDPDGPVCSCGKRGCLEAHVSSGAITQRLRQYAAVYPDSPLADCTDDLSPSTVVQCIGRELARGDLLARVIVDETAIWIGRALSHLVNALNPATIILGGPTAVWGDELIAAVERAVEPLTLPQSRQHLHIVPGQAGELAAPLGAAALVLQQAAELLAQPRRSRPDDQAMQIRIEAQAAEHSLAG